MQEKNTVHQLTPPIYTYLITLKSPENPDIQLICDRLKSFGYRVTVVQGVKGADLTAGDYFRLTNPLRARTGRLMTPGELGCVLSHANALKMAAASEDAVHLILEDDFIASDAALKWIAAVGHHVTSGTLLHLGGQEHMSRFYRLVRGHPIPNLPGAASVYPNDFPFLMCTVGYMVTAHTAHLLSNLMTKEPYLADDFGHALRHGAIDRIWFRWVISHPTEQTNSTIANDRILLNTTTKRHWSYRTRMNWAKLSRKLSTPPQLFLNNQQNKVQL